MYLCPYKDIEMTWFSRNHFIRHMYYRHNQRIEFMNDQEIKQYFTPIENKKGPLNWKR